MPGVACVSPNRNPDSSLQLCSELLQIAASFSSFCCRVLVRDTSIRDCDAGALVRTLDGFRSSDMEVSSFGTDHASECNFMLHAQSINMERSQGIAVLSAEGAQRDRGDDEEDVQMSESDTPVSTRFEKLVLEKIHSEMRSFADAQELMRRELSEIKVQLAEFRGEAKGRGKNEDGIESRVKVLEEKVDDLRLFKAKSAAYGTLGGTVFGSIASAIVGLLMRK